MGDQAAWTVMVYLAGDNDLTVAVGTDLDEMRRVGSSPEVNLVVQYDTAGETGTVRHRIERRGEGEKKQRSAEGDSGDPQTLVDFVAWCGAEFPADHYALVLWNHGSGWEPSEIDQMAERVGAPEFSSQEAGDRSSSPLGRVLFRPTLERILQLPTAAERAICSDDGTGHSLDTIELAGALRQAVDALGRPIDVLGMDACLMSNLEVAYQVAPSARYLVASEDDEPNNGWPWEAIAGRLVASPGLGARELAAAIADDYLKSYLDLGHQGPVTQSAFDLSQVTGVAQAVDELAAALLAAMPGAATVMWDAQRVSARFFQDTLWDLADFCRCLGDRGEPAVAAAAARAAAALAPGPGAFVVNTVRHGPSLAHSGGLSIYLVPPLVEISRWYGELALSQDHRWDELLAAYHAV